MRDLSSNVATYFNFSRIPGKLTPQHGYLLELLVPNMHVTLVKVLAQMKPARQQRAPSLGSPNTPSITSRECEILDWVRLGKTSWEIAQILNISEKTVKNHVQHALVKLRVKNRAQAVVKAMSLKILHAKN